ncbi:hypothetical protein, partial [Mycobacterium kansasii]|uniref:hypothetical protein n=1 Tax=Mycobacterium kansasii TaxID=1768 RepID=UPI0015E2150F
PGATTRTATDFRLVTDNAYIPYEPFTEVQVDAPSTLQFLFHGAFAERDDF